MHPDGDELLYLISGRVDVVIEEDGRERTDGGSGRCPFLRGRVDWQVRTGPMAQFRAENRAIWRPEVAIAVVRYP